MSYVNDGGCCNGGNWGMPFANMGGFGFGAGYGYEWLIMLLFFGMWGNGGFGFGGGRGLEQATTTAAETASLVGQQQTADRVAAIGSDVRQILGQTGGIIEAVNTVGNRAQDGFARLDTNLCQLGHAQSMQAVNNYNGLTNQLTDMRFAAQQCCCDTKQLIQSSFCDLRHQMQVDKCDTMQAIAASKAEILGAMQAARMAELEAKNLELKGQISQSNQTAQLAALIQQSRACGTCSPCCNPCIDGIQQAVNAALGTRIGEILFPTTTPTTA